MDQDSSSLLGAALDLVINRDNDWGPGGTYAPLSDDDRLARLTSLPGHPPKAECSLALERVYALLECAEFLGVLFHQGKPTGPERLRADYRDTSDGFTDDELRRAFWEGVVRMSK
jgi:hypothetical protein